jgi:hypothetical protein
MFGHKMNDRHLAASFGRNLLGKIAAVALAAVALTMATTTFATAEQPGIMCVQNELNALGFNAGVPDGTIGPRPALPLRSTARGWRVAPAKTAGASRR